MESTPNPTLTALVAIIIRHSLQILSGVGLIGGTYSDSMILVIASGLVAIATAAWGIWDQIQKARAKHAAAVVSAQIGAPVA